MAARRDGTARLTRDLGRRLDRVAARADAITDLLRDAVANCRTVPFAFDGCWFTIDPSTLLITGHYNAHLDGDADLRRTVNVGLAVNEYGEAEVNKFADLATRRRPAATLHQPTSALIWHRSGVRETQTASCCHTRCPDDVRRTTVGGAVADRSRAPTRRATGRPARRVGQSSARAGSRTRGSEGI